MSGPSPQDVAMDLAVDLTKLARISCDDCGDRRKPCQYHEGWGDGLDAFCRMFFSDRPLS